MSREGAACLVDEVLGVVLAEGLGGADDLVHVGVHELVDEVEVDFPAVLPRHRVFEAYHILMMELAQDGHLPQRPPPV